MTVTTYDSFEDMIAAIDEARLAADARVTEKQAALGVGDYFLNRDGLVQLGLPIVGEILETYEGTLQHYRFTKCYSECEPFGEMGDTHASSMVPLTKEDFDRILAMIRGEEPQAYCIITREGDFRWLTDG